MLPILTLPILLAAASEGPVVASVGGGPTAAILSTSRYTATRDRDALRKAYSLAMRSSSIRAQPDLPAVVPRLCSLYTELRTTRELAPSERRRMWRTLEARLERLRGKLGAKLTQLKREARSSAARSRYRRQPRKPAQTALAQAAGPLEIRNAQALIDLIQNTIAPESWDVNGGRGRIRYYDPLKVLVIRNTAEVHGQLGGVAQQLRK